MDVGVCNFAEGKRKGTAAPQKDNISTEEAEEPAADATGTVASAITEAEEAEEPVADATGTVASAITEAEEAEEPAADATGTVASAIQ